MASRIQDDMFTPEVIADPYTYYGRIRDEDPVHWNETFRERCGAVAADGHRELALV
jgi:hypothetical protein